MVITFTFPDFDMRGLSKHGQRYRHEGDLLRWLYDCAEALKNQGLVESSQIVEGLIKTLVAGSWRFE